MLTGLSIIFIGIHVKHGWAKRTSDWSHSSFHRYVVRGVYPENWGNHEGYDIEGLE
jgi:putative transposase